jgi:hypothetical protein
LLYNVFVLACLPGDQNNAIRISLKYIDFESDFSMNRNHLKKKEKRSGGLPYIYKKPYLLGGELAL